LLATIVEWRLGVLLVQKDAACRDYHYWDTLVELDIFIPQLSELNWLQYICRISSSPRNSPIS
jgi:hypothetical protein